MMTTIKGVEGCNRGYVRAVFSRRCGAHAVPVDLVRVNLRAVARVALRDRLAVAFDGYLVTECADDAALRGLEIGGMKRAEMAVFSEHRGGYASGLGALCVTGAKSPLSADYRDMAGGPLDAPDCLPGGGCDEIGALFGFPDSVQCVVLREPVEDSAAFVDGRKWREFVEGEGIGKSGPAGLIVGLGALLDGFAVESLDAPDFMAAGAMKWGVYRDPDGGYVGQLLAMRGGVW